MSNHEPQPTHVRLRLLAAIVAIALGILAIVVAVLFIRGALA